MQVPVAYTLADVAAWTPRNSAVTLGVFDGVHRGHRKIIETLVACRERSNIDRLYLLTFDPHPVVVTRSREAPAILSSIDERLELFSEFAIDGVFVVPFDRETSQMHYRDFIQRYFLDAFDMKRLVLGYDCHFGHRREGSPEKVSQEGPAMGFDVQVVPPLEVEGGVVSSTEIRDRLKSGNLAEANHLLGHPYLVRGRVTEGKGMGRDMGFPTANLVISNSNKLWPPHGVYAVRVGWLDRVFGGMMNVGTAPTLKGGDPLMEVHLFDFDHTLYGETLSVWCEAFLRDEQSFDSPAQLIEQLARDRDHAQSVLRGRSSQNSREPDGPPGG